MTIGVLASVGLRLTDCQKRPAAGFIYAGGFGGYDCRSLNFAALQNTARFIKNLHFHEV
jgi:hypothetical protein